MRALIVILFLGIFSISYGQDSKMDKLMFMYIEGDFKDCAWKAEKYMDKDEYRRHPRVYLYAAMSYYKISGMPGIGDSDEFRRPFKTALKYAYKFVKYDNKEEEYNFTDKDAAQDFLMTLKDSTVKLSKLYYRNDDFRKAAYYYSKIVKFQPQDYAVWISKGVAEIKARNVGEGIKDLKMAMDSLENNPGWEPDKISAPLLVEGLDDYAKILRSGEYDKYFEMYKFDVGPSYIAGVTEMKGKYEKYLPEEKEEKVEKEEEKKKVIRKFKSEEEVDEEEEEEEDVEDEQLN